MWEKSQSKVISSVAWLSLFYTSWDKLISNINYILDILKWSYTFDWSFYPMVARQQNYNFIISSNIFDLFSYLSEQQFHLCMKQNNLIVDLVTETVMLEKKIHGLFLCSE